MEKKSQQQSSKNNESPTLQRRLTLPLLVLYGLGVTVGAGIYVLVGLTASEAGMFAPISFLLAAFVVSFTGFTYAELSARYPVSAGEAAFVRSGLKSRSLALLVGLLVVASGVVSSAAISLGSTAYLENFVSVPTAMITTAIILTLGLVAAWGIFESVTIAAVLTVIEIGGLGLVVVYGFALKPDLLADIGKLVPPLEPKVWTGIVGGGLLAFFAFIGFEDLANVAEEARNPEKNMPRAILLTLVIATAIYLVVVSVVVLTVPMNELSQSASPLMLVFASADDTTRGVFNLVAALATLNGVLIQMIMSSRVLYGLASKGQLHKSLAYIHPMTRTPLVATALVVAIILMLALFLPIGRLAEMTSQIALTVFSFVNLALILLKMGEQHEAAGFQVPIWVPIAGFVSCISLLLSGLI
jgi:amino acid transporter